MDSMIAIRVPESLRAELERRAAQSERSLSGECRRILRDAIEPSAKPTESPRP